MAHLRCFFPHLSGGDAVNFVERESEGSFLIRKSEGKSGAYTLTAKCESGVVHTRIHFNGDGFEFTSKAGEVFPSLPDLVEHYMENKDQLVTNDGIPLLLKNPLTDPSSGPTSQRWYHGNISGKDAETILNQHSHQPGSFLVRDSRSAPGAFAYSIKTEGNIIKHVKINKTLINKFQLDQPDENGTGVAKQFDNLEELVDHYKEFGMVDTATSLIRPDIPVSTSGILAEHIYQRNTVLASGKGSTGYSEEFLELQQFEARFKNKSKKPFGKTDENMKKNRYRNIVPYDTHRVPLGPNSDYINASYVKHYDQKSKKKYISTQGPLPNTITDFWRMIYDECSPVIVMTALTVETARKKCEVYWPETKGHPIVYDQFQLELIEERNVKNIYKVRKIELRTENETREIDQYQFLKWPDFDVPENPDDVLMFLQEVSNQYEEAFVHLSGPMVVHCSAGIGRSGAFIVCDMICDLIKKNGHQSIINIQDAVKHCREHRPGMVQTEDQYRFIYRAIEHHVNKIKL